VKRRRHRQAHTQKPMISSSQVSFALVAGVLAGVLAAGMVSGAEQDKSVNDGVYTTAQAVRGQTAFQTRCTNCHDTARFTGEGFVAVWSGQPLSAIYEVMSTTMPEDNPGSLQPQQYADILSYFLRLNKFPEGQEELKGAVEGMKGIKFEGLKP
jgi:hypothetical protein